MFVECLKISMRCSRIFAECSRMFKNVCGIFGDSKECLRLSLEFPRTLAECSRVFVEWLRVSMKCLKMFMKCSRMFVECLLVSALRLRVYSWHCNLHVKFTLRFTSLNTLYVYIGQQNLIVSLLDPNKYSWVRAKCTPVRVILTRVVTIIINIMRIFYSFH